MAFAAAVAVLTFLVFTPSLRNSFVTWDDDLYVYENFNIRSLDARFTGWAIHSYHASNWHPLTWLSHAVDYAFWGLNPAGHHLTSILLHGLNAGMVVLLVWRLWQASLPQRREAGKQMHWRIVLSAAATGLLFGLHPLRVESVSWVAERKDVLCAYFFLLSLYVYAGHASRVPGDEAARQGKGSVHGGYLWSLVFFCLALLSKPMAVSLPLVLLILDWWPLQRMGRSSTGRVLLEKVPFFLLAIMSSVVTLRAQQAGGSVIQLQEIALVDRVLVACRSLAAYISRVVFPFDLVPFYPYPGHIAISSPGFLIPVVIVAGLTAMSVAGIRRWQPFSTVWGYYLATIFPVLGLVQVGEQAMADRYTYLPTLGFFFLAGAGVVAAAEKLVRSSRDRRTTAVVCLSGFLLLGGGLSYLSVRQMEIWKDDGTLWTRVIRSYPGVARAYNNLGVALLKDGKAAEARAMFSRAVGIDASNAEALNNLAVCQLEAGEYGDALRYALRAAAGGSKNGDAYNTVGEAYFALHEYEKALAYYLKALAVRSDYPSRYFNAALALERLGRNGEACAYWGEYLNRGTGLPDLEDVMQHTKDLGCRPSGKGH